MAQRHRLMTGERPMESLRHKDETVDDEDAADPGTAMLAMISLLTLAMGAGVLYGLFSF